MSRQEPEGKKTLNESIFKKEGASIRQYVAYRRTKGLQVSETSVKNRISLGYILLNEFGRIDVEQANYAWDYYVDGVRANRRLEPPVNESWKDPPAIYGKKAPKQEPELSARERKELAEAKMKEWNLKQQERTIIRTDLVVMFMNVILSGYRDQLAVIPKRVSDKIAAETDPNKIRIILEKAIMEAIANFHPIEEKLHDFINKELGEDLGTSEIQHVQRALSGASRE